MGFVAHIQPLKVFVAEEYLTQDETSARFVEAYLLSVKSKPGRPLLFTVYTEHGAIFSGLPINALYTKKHNPENMTVNCALDCEQAQPYSCLEGDISVIEYSLLKNGYARVKNLGMAHYLFTIDYNGEGLAEDPEQYKSHNIMALEETGQLIAVPNNFIQFEDNYFAGKQDNFPKYRRNSRYYKPGG